MIVHPTIADLLVDARQQELLARARSAEQARSVRRARLARRRFGDRRA